MPHDVRDTVVDFVNRWSELTEIAVVYFVLWLGISRSKFYNWRARYGMVNEHNGKIPRDFWIEDLFAELAGDDDTEEYCRAAEAV